MRMFSLVFLVLLDREVIIFFCVIKLEWRVSSVNISCFFFNIKGGIRNEE